MASQVKRSSYRQRIYQNSDGSIEICFGDFQQPLDAAAKLLADHDVTDLVTVTDHVDGGPVLSGSNG